MKYLILVKHSLPNIVEDRPAREWVLSEEGKGRAQALADQLRFYQPEIIVSSVEPKAFQTAEIVANSLGLKVTVLNNLHEHDRMNTAFLSKEAFESSIRSFFEKPDDLVFGKETANQAHQRFSRAVYSVLRKYGDHRIVIVAHGTVISLFVSRLTGLPEFAVWEELGLPSYVVFDMQSNIIVAKENVS